VTVHLSVFDDWQHITGLPGMIFGGLPTKAKLDGKHKDSDLYSLVEM
jgi:hypothetical protein